MKKHECNWDTVDWNSTQVRSIKSKTLWFVPDYFIGGMGETLERKGKCRECGKNFREVYVQSCIMDDDEEKITSL